MSHDSEEVKVPSRQEREAIGREINEGFARVERLENPTGASDIPTHPIGKKLSEDEVRKLIGEGNFEASKDSHQHNSTNS